MKKFLLLALLLFTLTAYRAPAAERSRCPELPTQPSVRWENTRSAEYWLCHAKTQSGETLLSAIVTSHPGVATFGFNFYKITRSNGRAITWFSDRTEDGDSKKIARAFFPTNTEDLPVMMVWFKFSDADDFKRKAALTAQLKSQ